jgi:uridine phosphorylase
MNKPHLTPEKLVGQRFKRDVFGDTKIALVGYCPPPAALKKYSPHSTDDQYFIHVTPDSVKKFSHGGINFLSLFHVYGGPVSASTVEELAYFGIEYVLAYGLAGGLGTKGLKMGDFYLVESALVQDGTTPHYSSNGKTYADKDLVATLMSLVPNPAISKIQKVQAVTGDAIYQEHDSYLNAARDLGCDIVNLDSSHLFAASIHNNENRKMKTVECGVISDVTGGKGEDWESTLSVMLSEKASSQLNPLTLTGKIVEFYVETLAPKLLSSRPTR